MNGLVVNLRPLLMWAAARLSRLAQPLIAARWVVVAGVGHPLTALAVVVWVLVGGRRAGLLVVLVAVAEGAYGVWAESPVRLWQLAWATRRRWPVQYTVVDHATQDVQASFGGAGSSFLRGSRSLTRPILGHPALSLLPRVDWESWTVTWAVHANAGQTLTALERVADALASRFPAVHRVDVDYPYPGASIGAIRFWYRPEVDALEEPETAVLPVESVPVGGPDDGLGDYDGKANW